MFKKEKSYPFKVESFKAIKLDEQKQKIDNISNIVFYIVILILLVNGTIGSKTIINMIVCSGTSKIVKWLIG